jgi:hypothetical protein
MAIFNGYIKLPEGTRKNEQVCNENLLMGSTKQVKQTCSIENKNESWAWVQIGINSGNRFMLAGKFTRNTGNVFIFREMWSGTEWFQQHLLVASLFIYTI